MKAIKIELLKGNKPNLLAMFMKNSPYELTSRTNTLIKVSQMKSAIHWCNWKAICLLLIVFGGRSVVGQVTLPHYEPINYTIGQALQTQASWTSLNGGDDIIISSGSLNYSGLQNSSFNKIGFDGTGIDAAKAFNQQTTGVVYYSFLLNVTSLGSLNTSGSYFTSFNEGTSTNFGATVWLRKNGTINYDIGINPRTTAANTIWSTGQSMNTTLLIVISYEMVSGSANDLVKLWINPIPGQNLPTPTLSATNTGGTDLINLNRVLLRQDGTTTTPFIEMDEIRIGNTWSSVTPSNSTTYTTSWSNSLPTANINAVIDGNLTASSFECANLTINSGKTLTIPNGSQLTVNGTLTNNGTLTIESGATLVQGATSTLAGTNPVYIVKQAVTGAGGTTPNGRFWYIGSPVSSSSSSVLFLGANDVVKKRDEPTNAWISLSSTNAESLEIGRGYNIRTGQSNPTINFTGGVINNNPTSNQLTLNLVRTPNVAFEGFNLVCNPYPSYLDWDLVTKDQVENTIWYRTADNTNTMVFETYVSGAANGIGTSISGNTATKLIPPMQSFWVRVASTYTSGSITLNNSMRSHFASYGSSTAGLRSTVNDFNLFLRMNLLQEDKKDQIIVYVNENSTNQYDAFDGEKMMQVDRPQFYTTASGKKIVINGLSAEDTQQSLPITMELTTTGTHQFMVEDLEIAAGNVWLEDNLKETYQLLEPGFGYKFFAYAGLTDDRFVLHLKLKDANSPSTPNFDAANEMAANHANVYTEGAGVVVIKLPTTDDVATDVQIYDAAGRTFFSGTMKSLETKIQLEQAKGIYYVSLTSVNGVEVRKVFID